MGNVQRLRADGTGGTPRAADAADQDALYSRVAGDFGPPLARLAAAYELEPARQQDLLQELHFAVWRSLAAFRSQCSLRTWVYRVAHNTATTYVRQQRRSRRLRLVSLEDLDEVVQEIDFERSISDADVRKKLRDLIEHLKPIDRDVLLLCLEGLKAAEIGEVVGISPSNAAQKIAAWKRAGPALERETRVDKVDSLDTAPYADFITELHVPLRLRCRGST